MVINLAYPSKSDEESVEVPVDSMAAESESASREEQADVSRSTNRGAVESGVKSREREFSVKDASRIVATEIYSNGLHHREVAEKYGVSVEAVKWLMKERGIGFSARDMGAPPEYVRPTLFADMG